ncbi:hypothetical protein CWD94_11855 [Lysinibacillus xylanilyticus]|uniref:Uncharacterized protein n=1 Tax=Lysinibacillus xylanilyticus TaxID=582475 RepID=A0A2M9Q647_9BACI|nr:hypothetical protein CWD94_11855 [Lysinibacillus xylanilyticus]
MQNSTKYEHNLMKKLIFMSKGTVSFSIMQYNRINMIFFLHLVKELIFKKIHRGEANDQSIENY